MKKGLLPVDVHGSKTSLPKLPSLAPGVERGRESGGQFQTNQCLSVS